MEGDCGGRRVIVEEEVERRSKIEEINKGMIISL
jgi:hypothetical protein